MRVKKKEKNLFIIRHGETDFNRMNIVQGSGVDTDLNERGREQAGLFFKQYGHMPFDRLYTSALKRSIQSVDGFIHKGVPHTALPELNEISWGDFEGKFQTEDQRQHYWEVVSEWNRGNVHAKIPNGESPHELQGRQRKAVEQILHADEGENVLICMHGRAMKSLLCLLLDKSIADMENFQHSNLCLYVLSFNGETCTLLRANDTEHLQNTNT